MEPSRSVSLPLFFYGHAYREVINHAGQEVRWRFSDARHVTEEVIRGVFVVNDQGRAGSACQAAETARVISLRTCYESQTTDFLFAGSDSGSADNQAKQPQASESNLLSVLQLLV